VRPPVQLTAFDLAQRFIGTAEVDGRAFNPQILAMLRLDSTWPADDSVAWCSAFVSYVCHLLSDEIPRSKSLGARSWLRVGEPVTIDQAVPGFDVVVLKRGGGNQPGPEVIQAAGHVGFFGGIDGEHVIVRGGNQGDEVSDSRFPIANILGIRRL
jgi:uncharacterized protein (TIGR02594 family)